MKDEVLINELTGTGRRFIDLGKFKKPVRGFGQTTECRLELEKAINAMSSRHASGWDIDNAIQTSLGEIGRLSGASRAYLFLFQEDGATLENTHEWCAEGVRPRKDNLRNFPADMFGWRMKKLARGDVVYIEDVSKLPEEAMAEKEMLESQGIKSLLVLPLNMDGKLAGFIGFDNVDEPQKWNNNKIMLLRIFSRIVANGLERKQAEETIRYLAYYDTLTGLPNRLMFESRLVLALDHASRNGEMLAVIFIGLDRFKNINDTLGYATGDLLLKAVAGRLSGAVGKSDTLACMGGDEFMLLLPEIRRVEDAASIAQKILDQFQKPFLVEGCELYITASIGISIYPHDGYSVEVLMKNADTAMCRAKDMGRNNYQFFTADMNVSITKQLNMVNSLRHAFEKEELVIYYQPKVDIKTGRVIGMEALVRWQHPELGLISPEEFIPVAEETGLIVPIGEWVMRTACAQNKAWQDAGFPPLRVAVNLSARQFQDKSLINTISGILKETGLEPCYLELEITESTVVRDMDFTVTMLRRLKEMGIHISLDDFGVGYSSLRYLIIMTIDALKIDQSFIRDLFNNPKNKAIISSIISLAHNLNLEVTAEGVETEEQLDFLKKHQCDSMQGFLFSKPLTAEEFENVLTSGKHL